MTGRCLCRRSPQPRRPQRALRYGVRQRVCSAAAATRLRPENRPTGAKKKVDAQPARRVLRHPMVTSYGASKDSNLRRPGLSRSPINLSVFCGAGAFSFLAQGNGEHVNWIGDVLQHRLAQIDALGSNCAPDQPPDVRRNAYAAGPRKTFDPRHEIHGMAIDVLGLDDDVAETNGHSQIDTLALLHARIAHHHGFLLVETPT